ncbi:MAG: prepilin-type N-terminal cleavage/methylation domain-containing protein [Providencia sp.]|jgi:prepilin peptidase dependent protein A|nr:prepilin-type N-terminal cleavage/methylation domain-containing protein [Providencia sp.]
MKIELKQTQLGFTLIEILVVLFICSLTVFSGLHYWGKYIEQQRLIDTVRQLSEFIYHHVKEGIYLNRHQTLFVNIGKAGWWMSIKDVNTRQEIGRITSDKFQGIELAKSTRTSIELYGKQGTSRAFSFQLKNNDSAISIYMSALGRVRTCSHHSVAGVPKC